MEVSDNLSTNEGSETRKKGRPRKKAVDNASVATTKQTQTAPSGTLIISRTAYGVETDTTEKITVPLFPTTPATVRVGGHVTKNLGNYESAKIAVEIEMPCLPEHSEVLRVYQMVSGWIDDLVAEELNKLLEE